MQEEEEEELQYQPPEPSADTDNHGQLLLRDNDDSHANSDNNYNDTDNEDSNNHLRQPENTRYVSLQINHSTSPHHRGKQKSFQSIATELSKYSKSQYTRLSSQQSGRGHNSRQTNQTLASVQYSVVSAYSSFVPAQNDGLLQIEYELEAKTSRTQTRLIYAAIALLFTIFYILLFIEATVKPAEYLVVCVSLAASLIFTMMPSYIPIPIPCLCKSDSQGDIDAESYNKKNTEETIVVTVRKWRFPLDQSTVPVICVLLLMASGDEHFAAKWVWEAIKGTKIKPWAVLGVLFGLCYLCITLDLTGILKGLAQKTADLAGSYQTKLFLYIFLFAAVLTAVTNNDISIICLTPLACSTANAGNLESTPYIFMILFTSNTFSMLLITGNPANLIVSQAADLDYISYLKYMALPTIITGLLLYTELYLMFRKRLQRRIPRPEIQTNWKDLVKLPKYSVFCGIRLFLACIGIPIASQIDVEDLDMFVVVGIAVISFFIDLMAFDIRRLAQFSSTDMNNYEYKESLLAPTSANGNNNRHINNPNLDRIDETQEEDDDHGADHVEMSSQLSGTIGTKATAMTNMTNMTNIKGMDSINENMNMHNTLDTRVTHDTFQTYDSNQLLYDKLKLKIETFAFDALWELPWKLIPFVFGLFILVKFMERIGLVLFLAKLLLNIENTWAAMFIVGFTATILCQCVNNQPMTVLMSFVLDQCKTEYNNDNDLGDDGPGPPWLTGAFFALAIGANLGGNGTPIASLAVLMWQGILAKWKIYLTYFGFSKRGIGVTPLLVAACVSIVAIEVQYIFKS